MSTDAATPTITCPDHPTELSPPQARELAWHLLGEADTVSPQEATLTRQQILLELDALRAQVTTLGQLVDAHLPPAPARS